MTMLGLTVILIAATVAGSYFLGCINGALIISKFILRDDVRNHGSGNAGLTNFYRVFGGKLTLLVIVCDMAKTAVAVVLGMLLMGRLLGMPLTGRYVAGIACMVGHMYPCMFRFKGGKGVLAAGVIVFFLDWRVALATWGLFIILLLLSRMVSAGSLAGSVGLILSNGLVYQSVWFGVLGLVIGGLVIFQHRGNIVRIVRGEERTFHLHRSSDSDAEDPK